MRLHSRLPPPPHFDIEVLEALSTPGAAFLSCVSRRCQTRSPQGQLSQSFLYDEVERSALDAVVIVAHFLGATSPHVGERLVVLRSALRPPVVLRDARRSPMAEPENRGLWEAPAGLIDEGEEGPEGVRRAAARELLEETGFAISPDALCTLGPSSFPSPGVISERHFYFHVEVDPLSQKIPALDGSPLEEAGEVICIPLDAALDAAREGLLSDAKTELALRRLKDLLMEKSP